MRQEFITMSRSNSLIFSVLFAVLCSVYGADLTPIIQTNKGQVRGTILKTVVNSKDYAAFKGIPYGEAPVGQLRFKPPVEKKAWTEVLNASVEGSWCAQYDPRNDPPISGTEDCLNLNVYTPHTTFGKKTTPKAVLVWIFGGSFAFGNADAVTYGPDFLLEEDVIVVTLNYRLSALGFLNLGHEGANGNMGLKDQNLALKWVQKNIANFGGDPKRVTLIGQSAGGVAVDLHKISDMSKGLIQQTISMSGSVFLFYADYQTAAEAEEVAFELGSNLGVQTSDKNVLVQKLREASVADIVTASAKVFSIPFRPTLERTDVATNEDKFLTECYVKKVLSGNYVKGPHITGFTSDETVFHSADVQALMADTYAVLKNLSTDSLKLTDIPFSLDIPAAIQKGAASLTENERATLLKEMAGLLFTAGIDTAQQYFSKHNDHPIYYYRFSYDTEYSAHAALGIQSKGVGHLDDVPFLFYLPWVGQPLQDAGIKLTRERYTRLFANFAKYGNPTPKKDDLLGVTWTDSRSDGSHLEIGAKLSMGPRPVDEFTKKLQKLDLGASPILHEC